MAVAGKVEASELGELRGAYAAFLSDFRELLQSQLAEVRERTAKAIVLEPELGTIVILVTKMS